jgi:hypothetical protein
MKKYFWFIGILIVMGLLSFFSGCSYTAPFLRFESVSPDAQVIVTLSAVEHRKGQRKPFFEETGAGGPSEPSRSRGLLLPFSTHWQPSLDHDRLERRSFTGSV